MHHVPRAKVVLVAGMQREKRRTLVRCVLSAVDKCLVAANNRRGVPLHHPRGTLVFGDPEQLRKLRHERVGEICEPLARHDVLVDADPPEIGESLLVAWEIHDEVVVRRRAADEEITKDRRAGRRTADYATTGEHFIECGLGLCAGVRIHEVELPPALEPHTARLLEDRHERVRVGEFPIGREQHVHVLRSRRLPAAGAGRILRVLGGAAGVGNVDDEGVRSAGRRDKPRIDLGAHRPAAHDDHGSVSRPDSR